MKNDEINSGSYHIIMKLEQDTNILIGCLGNILFPKGYYVYTGSAMKNLRQRTERHSKRSKKLKWHIDYFLNNESVRILDIKIKKSLIREECSRNQLIMDLPGAEIPAKKFGASDCTKCPSHLVHFKNIPDI